MKHACMLFFCIIVLFNGCDKATEITVKLKNTEI